MYCLTTVRDRLIYFEEFIMSDNKNLIKEEINRFIDAGFIPEIDYHINTFGFKESDDEKEVTGNDVIITSVKNFLNPDYRKDQVQSKFTPVGLQVLGVLNGILNQCNQPGHLLGQAVFCHYEEQADF